MNAGPLRGDNFVEWADRLRNVEEMLDQPAMRTEVAQAREAAEAMRAEFKRHSVEPQWDLVKTKISAPLAEMRDRVSEELARRESRETSCRSTAIRCRQNIRSTCGATTRSSGVAGDGTRASFLRG